jgi:histidine ammonia-lyase
MTAISALLLYDADRLIRHAEIACAMSLEALLANLKPYDERVHRLRGFRGAIRSAASIRACIDGRPTERRDQDEGAGRILDALVPQVIGAAHDALAFARSQVETELNGVGDNPIFVPDENLT